ncbi:MAG TPA: hypothetical protein VGF17_15740, partial [Phytomonospora sp.]
MSPKPFSRVAACAAAATAVLALSGCGSDVPDAGDALGRVGEDSGDIGVVLLLTVVGGLGAAALIIWLVIRRNRAAAARAKQVRRTTEDVPKFAPAVVSPGNVPTVPPAQRPRLPKRTPGGTGASGPSAPASAPALEPTKKHPAVRPEDLGRRRPSGEVVPEPTKLEPAVRREYLADPSEPTEKQAAVSLDEGKKETAPKAADPHAPTEKQAAVSLDADEPGEAKEKAKPVAARPGEAAEPAVRPLSDPERAENAPVAPEETVLMPAVRLEDLPPATEAEAPVWGAEYTAPMDAVTEDDADDAEEKPDRLAETAPARPDDQDEQPREVAVLAGAEIVEPASPEPETAPGDSTDPDDA